MIVRIVKMTFKSEEVDHFLKLFAQYRHQIRQAEGCLYLELLQDQNDPTCIMTYSHWEKVENLDTYRHSDLFKEVWPQSKALFAQPAQAWTMDRPHRLP